MVCGDAALDGVARRIPVLPEPHHAARGKVLLYLLLTMPPFAVVAPVLGPAARPHQGRAPPARDRRRRPVRALLCVFMAHVHHASRRPTACSCTRSRSGCWCWPRATQIAKSALAARAGDERRGAGQRQLAARAGRAHRRRRIGGLPGCRHPAAVRLRLVAAVRGDRLRRRRRSWPRRSRGRARAEPRPAPGEARARRAAPAEHPARRRARWRSSAASVGFLAFFAAFSLKSDLFALGSSLVASVLGGFIGVIAAPRAPAVVPRGGDRRVGARDRRGRSRCSARSSAAAAGSGSPRWRSRSARRAAGSGSTACCSATAPTPFAGAPSPASRPASSSCGSSAGMRRHHPVRPDGRAVPPRRSCSASPRSRTSRRCGRRALVADEAAARGGRPRDQRGRDRAVGEVRSRFRVAGAQRPEPTPS